MSNYNIPYLVGDKLDRDVQYWPTVTPTEYAAYYSGYPARTIAFTLKQIMAAWRVKKWKLSGHVSVTLQVGFTGYPPGVVTFDFRVPPPPAVVTWTYADAATRLAATGFVSGDIGKIAHQSDDDSYWTLTAITPVWVESGSIEVPIKWNKSAVFTTTFAAGLLNCVGHGLVANQAVAVSSNGVLPGGMTARTYFVIAAGLTANAFKVSLTIGGAPIVLTNNGSGTHTWSSGDAWDCAQEPDLIAKVGISEHYRFHGLRNLGFFSGLGGSSLYPDGYFKMALSGSSVALYMAVGGGGIGVANPWLVLPTSAEFLGPPFLSFGSGFHLFTLLDRSRFFGPPPDGEYVVFNLGAFDPSIVLEGYFVLPHASFDGGDIGLLVFSTNTLIGGGSGTLTVHPGITPDFDIPMMCGGTLSQYQFGTLDPDSAGTCEFDLTAVEFWPYQNSLGQPVYDTTTGAQINNPFA